jgi:hypothetical protein
MHEAYAATGDSYVIFFQYYIIYFFVCLFSGNALQLLLELLGTYTKETAPKARSDASKYKIKFFLIENVFRFVCFCLDVLLIVLMILMYSLWIIYFYLNR